MHYVETLRDSHFLGTRGSAVMKVCLDLGWVGRKLNSLATQIEDVGFELLVVLLQDI